MKSVMIMIVLIGTSRAAVIPEDSQATIVNYENNQNGVGNYNFSFETSNGIKRSEIGRLVNAGQEDEHIEVRGEYSYYDLEGKLTVVKYVADENGYQEIPAEGSPELTITPEENELPDLENKIGSGLSSAAFATLLGRR